MGIPTRSKDEPGGIITRPRTGLISREGGGAAIFVVCAALVMTFYVWLISIGTWSEWPSLTQGYAHLASAFLHGQLALEGEPSAALLALEDPYDPEARQGVPAPLDVSLYGGRFYLYFGPIPGVIMAAVKLAGGMLLGDEYLVFVFAIGLFIVQSLFLHAIWRRFFPEVSAWSFGGGLLVLGLAPPIGWLLSEPYIYNAAILGGAFFLMAGLLAAFVAVDGASIRSPQLALAGIFWAAAVGSRMNQAVPVALLAGLTVIAILVRRRSPDKSRGVVRPLLALLLPLGIGAAILGWYNWSRFGSPFETGVSYMLSVGFQEQQDKWFSPLLIPHNLANYFLAPPRLGYAFPYFKPGQGFQESVIPGIELPIPYYSSSLSGLLYTAPFVVFSLFTVRPAFRRPAGGHFDEDQRSQTWLTLALWTACLSAFILLLSYFWSAERYLADFVPALYLLSLMGFWQLQRSLSQGLPRRAAAFLLGLGLFGTSILISNLLAIALNATGFRALNPVLWRQLGNLFRP